MLRDQFLVDAREFNGVLYSLRP